MFKSNQDDLSKLHNIRLPTKKLAIVSRLPPSASSFKLHVLKAGKQRHGVITNKYGNFYEDRIYWTETGNRTLVRSAFFDGSDSKIIIDGMSVGYLFGIATTQSNVYFSTWDTGELFQLSKNNASASNNLIYATETANIMSIKTFQLPESECFNYMEILNGEKRSTGYNTDLEIEIPISDDEIDGGWYRIMSDNGDKIPTYPSGLYHCGTVYPVWLNGSLPASWKTNSVEACQQTDTDICETSLNITISNCGSYYVYYLSGTPENSSYCFGEGPVACPANKSSESGYFQDAVVNAFDDISNGSHVYDVFWKINGKNVTSKLNVPFENIDSTLLRDTDWVGLYTMNMEVKCSIRMRYSTNATPGKFIESQNFLAGLFPEKYDYTVIEGEKIEILFTATVPVSCIASHEGIKVHCDQKFYIFQPELDQQSFSCLNNIVSRDVVFRSQFCGINIGTNDWQVTQTLDVYGFSDGIYNFKDRSTSIRISTGTISTFNDIWKNINIPDIKVTVLDKDTVLTNRLCQSVNDPHIITFDGRYYHFMDVGEFVMYRNDRGPYWVHALFTNCGFGWEGSSCHCGIAIRSRNSRFVIRTCKTISRTSKSLLDAPITQLDSCNDNDLLIKHTGNKYKVTIPSGTEITITISRLTRFIGSVSIKPSVFDIDRVKGLCGVPSITLDPSDDYTHRTNGPINDYQDFARSWRITTDMTDEQMFVETPTFISNSYNIDTYSSEYINNAGSTYCACEKQVKSTDSFDEFYTVHCNLTESTEYCPSKSLDNTVNAYQSSCSRSQTTKRSIGSREIVRRSTNDNDDVIEFLSLTYDEDINSTDKVQHTFRNGWTEINAYQECLAVINNTLPSDLYGDFADLQRANYIIGCVKDIEDTIEAMVINIMTEIQKNESLYLFNSTEGNQTILEYISAKLCPGNCSGHGNCTIAVCICFDGFIGDDCSHSVVSPPTNISLPSYGLCSTATRSCQKTNVYVDMLSETVWYRIRHFQILDDLIIITSDWEADSAEYRSMFMVSVNLHNNRKRRSVSNDKTAEGYEISLSYDNQNYGDVVSIIIYDETCYSCNSTTRTCINLAGCKSSNLKSEIVKGKLLDVSC
ncbi:unnamed protein product [Mytilus edulis]|uniref:VWFD domain-containing protein n=1 Tax=Mytilus edulis TaxID=6550 RepID=A0A8S3UQS5_MYTED|nr:unnamed protein product [Mytilus edulis]